MSGPKCYSYSVAEDPAVVAARQEAAALAAARARAESAVARLRLAEREASGLRARHGDAISEVRAPTAVPAAGSSSAMAHEAEQLERQAHEVEARLRNELGEARKASFISQLASGAGAPPSAAAGLDRLVAAAAARAAEAADVHPDERAAIAEECVRVYERLRLDVSEDARSQVEKTLQIALAAAAEDRAPLLVDRLRSTVRAANAAATARQDRVKKVDQLLAGLGDVGEAEEQLRGRLLDERESGRALEVLAAEVDRARATARAQADAEKREADRAHVVTALDESLRELGYDVQAGFETALAADGSALARRAGWTGHAVRVLLDPTTDELRLHVVRDAQELGADNVAREKEFCDDRPALEQALSARGVEIDPQELIEPGVVPVAVASLTRAAFPRRRRAARDRPREQQA